MKDLHCIQGHDGTVSGINNQLQCELCCICNYAHVQVQFECQMDSQVSYSRCAKLDPAGFKST